MLQKNLHKLAIENRRARDKSRRKQEIVDASRKVFLSKGYINATMDDIALEAGISKITIYRYFVSKDSLYYTVIVPVIDTLTESLQAVEKNLAEGKYQSGADFVCGIFQAFHQFYLLSPDTFRLIQLFQQAGTVWNLDDKFSLSLNEKGKRNARISRRIYQEAVDRDFIKKLDAQYLQEVLYGAFLGIIQISEFKSHRTGIGSDAEGAKKQLMARLELLENIIIDSIVCK